MASMETKIEQVVDTILEDYRHGRDIDKIEQFRKPDKDIVIVMIEKLRRIVSPAISGRKPTGPTRPSTIFPCSLRMYCLTSPGRSP